MPLRSTIVGAATGVVLLAGVFGFAVGLPEVTGDEPEATDDGTEQGGNSKPVAELLPESLLNQALVRFKDLDPRYVAVADEFETYGAEKLTEAFGTDVATAVYVTPGLDAQAIVTLYDGESGLFLQDGPPEPPAMSGGQRPIADVVRIRTDSRIPVSVRSSAALSPPDHPLQVLRVSRAVHRDL